MYICWKITLLGLCILWLGCQSKGNKPTDEVPQAVASAPATADAPAPVATPPKPAASSVSSPAAFTKGQLDEMCRTLCDNTESLKCGDIALCLEGCHHMAEIPVCSTLAHAFIACISKEPAAHFECNEAGIPSIKDGFCDAEQAALFSCLSKN